MVISDLVLVIYAVALDETALDSSHSVEGTFVSASCKDRGVVGGRSILSCSSFLKKWDELIILFDMCSIYQPQLVRHGGISRDQTDHKLKPFSLHIA